MSVIGSNILAGASGQGGYFIDRSLRFRSSASAYLNWTPSSAGDRRTWTFSLWAKLGYNSSNQRVFGCHLSANDLFGCYITTGGQLVVWSNISGVASLRWNSNALLRDYSAWYHLVFVLDTTQATSTDRFKVYLNNEQLTTSSYTAPAQNSQQHWNNTNAMWIGKSQYAGNFDGYLTEANFIDGQALDPSSFGEYNDDTGVWQPKKYVGTYGTNGFYLNFSDNSSTTTLGEDGSGNGNDWTLNNFSLTSGSTYDSMTDVPTLTSTDAANYAVMNPLDIGQTSALAKGNLDFTTSSNVNYSICRGTFGLSSGKWYWEVTMNSAAAANGLGIAKNNAALNNYLGADANGYGWQGSVGSVYNNGTGTSYNSGATFTNGDVIGVALNMDAGTLVFYKNGVSQGTAASSLTDAWFPAVSDMSSSSTANMTANFGATPFAYTPPTGFKALNTYNLPDSTVKDGSDYFNTVLYTGNTSGASVTGVGFQPDFVWAKNRSVANNHELIDVVRGGSSALFSNLTNAEATQQRISSFDSDGWTYTTNSNSALANPYVGWTWKANGSGVSNTDGSITSTVSANTTAGFSIVTYTGTGANATVGHGLGVAPKMVIVKRRSTLGSSWVTFNSNLANAQNNYLALNTTAAAVNDNSTWGGALPTTSVFSIGTLAAVNQNTSTHVAYCFAEVDGFSKMGSYTGNGSADGPFVFTGFRPAFVMVKRTDSAGNWTTYDDERLGYNADNEQLYPNLSNAEGTSTHLDLLSNGFKWRTSDTSRNASGGTYIYMAFAENPAKYALAR